MDKSYTNELINYITTVGKELVEKSGEIKDIGVKKQWSTEWDTKIERGIKEIIDRIPGEHQFYSEEENDNFINAESVWVADPISGTKRLIEGLDNYAIAVGHMTHGKADFAVVYNPTADKLYVAYKNEGVFINNEKYNINRQNKNRIIYAPSYKLKDPDVIKKAEQLRKLLEKEYELYPSQGAFALNYCLVAEGSFDGIVCLQNDAFPEFAGCFIANESGMTATNIHGDKNISPDDRVFVCGDERNYERLLELTREVVTVVNNKRLMV